MKGPRRKLIVALALVGAACGVWISRRPEPPVNLLLITLDTTRADRIGCYGYELALTPQLDALAKRGVLFERAYAPAPMTSPSHTSMMTGLWPPEHGVVSNGLTALDDDIPTVAESLRRRGYLTAAFPAASMLQAKFGLDRGFQIYDDDLSDAAAGADPLHRSRDGRHVIDAVRKFLTRNQARKENAPFFCWVHLYDAHDPYRAHADEFGDQFADRPYDGELAYVDRQLGRLFDTLAELGLTDRTAIVVVGDHGESLGEHGERQHGYMLHESTLRVPLIIADPRRQPDAGRRVAAPVSLVDLFPTLLELGEAGVPQECQARSLGPALAGKPLDARMCYSQTEEPYLQGFWSPLQGLTTERWRYVRTTKPELYDLTADPRELENLAERQPDRVAELDGELAALEGKFRRRTGPAVTLSTQEQRALESLGYAGGSSAAAERAAGDDPLPDIKDMIPYLNRLDEASELMEAENYEEAAALLEPLARAAPTYLRVRLNLGQCRLQQQNYDDAVRWFRSALEIDPNSDRVLFLLGFAYLKLRNLELAESQFVRLLELQPESEDGYLFLGEVQQRRGNLPLALQHYEKVLRFNPQHATARQAAEALRQAGVRP